MTNQVVRTSANLNRFFNRSLGLSLRVFSVLSTQWISTLIPNYPIVSRDRKVKKKTEGVMQLMGDLPPASL
jgi:hypothetical protein